MMKKFLLVLCLIIPLSVNAEQIDFGNLTPAEVAQIKLDIENKKQLVSGNVSAVKVEKLDEYAAIGKSLGSAINEMVVTLGTTLDKFSKTNVGMLTIAILAYKIVGAQLVGVFVGLLLLVFGNACWLYFYNRFRYNVTYVWHENGKKKEKHRERGEVHKLQGEHFIYWITLIFLNMTGLMIAF